jgi:hypothetical protein
MDLSLGSDPAAIAWQWDAPRFVRAYRSAIERSQPTKRLGVSLGSIGMDEHSLERLMILGYLVVRGDEFYPAQKALDAEAADAGIGALREFFAIIGTPYSENLARAMERPIRERMVYPLASDASPLVGARWFSERAGGYVVTIHGAGALEEVLKHGSI